jgi:hypothetical protein
MALRRPSISSPEWLFQDFLYQDTPDGQERYVQVKWDGEVYERKSSTYDYSNPPFADSEQRGGHIVAQLDYDLDPGSKLVTITSWEVNWRDEYPLRLGVNYLIECLYSAFDGYVIRVVNNPHAFWVSEKFYPIDNRPDSYLVR